MAPELVGWLKEYEQAEVLYINLYGDSMAFNLKKGGGDFENAPVGTFRARCIRLIDLGTQEKAFKGEKKRVPLVLITWELLGEEPGTREDGKPFIVQQEFTNSNHEKSTLMKMLTSWRGSTPPEDYDMSKIVGQYCFLTIVHKESNGNTYANIANVAQMLKSTEKPAGVNETVIFNLAEPDWQVFSKLSDKLKERIKLSPEYADAIGAQREPGADEEEEAEIDF